MSIYNRDDIIKDLKQTVCEVTFTKVNGEKRVMRCTLDPRYMPTISTDQIKHLDENHNKPENQNIVACWDVHAGGWRSFRVDSVEYMQEVNGY
jgi:WYL_2, Sm-like SH3 beta-barrel fold